MPGPAPSGPIRSTDLECNANGVAVPASCSDR
jgi:hypothetical protein